MQERGAEFDVALEAHHLEAFAHFAGQREALGFLAQAIALRFVVRARFGGGEVRFQAVADQEARL